MSGSRLQDTGICRPDAGKLQARCREATEKLDRQKRDRENIDPLS